jgi:hypothetical protein
MSISSVAIPKFMRAAPLYRFLGLSKNTFERHLKPLLTPYQFASFVLYEVEEALRILKSQPLLGGKA